MAAKEPTLKDLPEVLWAVEVEGAFATVKKTDGSDFILKRIYFVHCKTIGQALEKVRKKTMSVGLTKHVKINWTRGLEGEFLK